MNIPFPKRGDADDSVETIVETVTALAQGPIAGCAREVDRTAEFPLEVYRQLGKTGCLTPTMPEELGGIGLPTPVFSRLVEIIAGESAALGNAVISAAIPTNYLRSFGSDQLRAKIAEVASGESIMAVGFSEPESGSDLASLQTTATPVDGGFRVTGQKAWSTLGGVCDEVIVLARLPEESKPKLVALLVNTSFPGFSRGKHEDLMGMRGLGTCPLMLDDVFVPSERVIGVAGKGLSQTLASLTFGRIVVGSLAAGIARGALARSTAYAQERRQFGRKIWDFQNSQFRTAELASRLMAVESLLADTADTFDRGEDAAMQASAAKLLASDLAMDASVFAVQMHGAMGYTKDLDVERLVRDAKVTQIYEGTNEIQRLLLAQSICPRD